MQAAGLAAGVSTDTLGAGETSHLDFLTKAQHTEGVRRPGWLLKLQGSGREQNWTRYWVRCAHQTVPLVAVTSG